MPYFYSMQVYANSNRVSVKTILFFVLVLFLAYLPVTTFLFFLKNDAFNGYFPPKFFMSESIHSGFLPLWNPYINFGIPQYGDMSSGYWSPITWLIASTAGYNAYTLTIELLFYIFLAGVGMYRLTGIWITDKHIRFMAAIAFMCSGYHIGHLQHFNWLSGAAFLPFCTWSYERLLKNVTLRNSLVAAFFFYMLLSSAHPGISISALYFFGARFVYQLFQKENSFINNLGQGIRAHMIFLPAVLLISAGMIAGYADILPHFVRSEKVELGESLQNPANLQSWISAVLPFATVKNDSWYRTDISMRNCYFGLVTLMFFLAACFSKKTNWQKFLLWMGFAFMLLAFGGIFKTIAWKYLPLIGYVRLDGEFRVMALLCFTVIGAIAMEKHISSGKNFSGNIKPIYYILEIVLFAAIIYGLYGAFWRHESFLYHFTDINAVPGTGNKLKALIDAITFGDTLWIQGTIQMLFLWGIKWCLRSGNISLLTKLVVVNTILISLMNIPFTGVGKSSVADVQAVLNKSPKGIPVPALKPVLDNDTISVAETGLVGNWSLYNKQPGVLSWAPYPIVLHNMHAYFKSGKTFTDKPFVFLDPANDSNDILINTFSPNEIALQVRAASSTHVVLQQNHYPHWFYRSDSIKKPAGKAGLNFMSAPVDTGTQQVVFSFEPVFVKRMMMLSLVSFVLLIIVISFLTIRSSFPSLHRR
jgi:hypothetical protein